MEVTDGSLSWAATIDDSQMAEASEQIEQYFRSIGMSAEAAHQKTEEAMKMMAKAVNDALEEAGTGAEAIDVLNAAIENMKQQLANMPEGEMRQTLEGVVMGFEDVRDEMSRTIQETGQLGDSFGNTSDILVRLLGGTENYSKIISGLPGPLRSAISGIKGMTTAARAFIATPLGAIIAAIVLALQAMRAWLTSSAEGQMRLAETTGYLKGILGQLKEIVIDIGEWLVKAFDDPKQAVSDLGSKIKNNLMNRLQAVGEIGQAIGKILKSAFDLDTEGMKEGVTLLTGSIVQFSTGIDKIDFAKKVLSIGDAAEENAKIARERLELEVEESKWNVRRAELEKLMNDANAKMYNTSLGASERKKALDEYKKYNKEIEDAELEIIDRKINLQEREMALTTNSIEDENKLRELQAERYRIQGAASQRLASLQRRENAIENAGQSATTKRLETEKKTANELLKLTQANREKELELKREGYAKELEAARVAYTKELEEIEKLDKKWREAQEGVLSEDQQEQLDKAKKLANETLVKNNADVLREMLTEYGDYTAAKEAIDEQYYDNIAVLDKMMSEATTENQRKALQAAKEMAGKNWAKDILGIGLDEVNRTTYRSVGERIDAINDVYAKYIASLQLAGASEQEVNKAKAEQVALTGKVAVIEAQIADLEQQRTLLDIADPKDAKEIERLNREIDKLKKQLDLINAKQGSKGVWADFLAGLDVQEVVGWLNGMGDAIVRIGEAAESSSIKDAGEAISGIANAAQGVAQGFAQGGIIGAAVSLAATIGSEIVDFIATEQKMQRAIEQAGFDKFVADQQKVLEGMDSIFGEDTVGNAERSIAVINAATAKLKDLEEQLMSLDEQRRNAFFISDRGSYMSMVAAYQEAIAKGQSGIGAVSIRTKDRSGFANWLGMADEFKSLEDAAKDLGYALYDESGILNKEALQAIIDTYEDLGTEERQWIENAISDLELYEDAVAETTEYLKSLFGDMADTWADAIVDGFLQGEDAAINFEKATADVAKQMAKDFIKNMLFTEVFQRYQKQFQSIMLDQSTNTEEKQKAMLAYFAAMQADAEALQPSIQLYLETIRQFFGEEAEISSQSGNLLQNATQDSIDLVNGQMNAIRMNQMRIVEAVDSVLISISGLREDMNRGFGESVNLLRGIENNTGNTNNSIIRGLGLQ